MDNQTPETPDLDTTLARAAEQIDTARLSAENALATAAGTDLELRADNAVDTKKRLAAGFGAIAHSRSAAEAAMREAQAEVDLVIKNAQEMLAAKMAELQPLIEHARKLEDGIKAVNLYLGRDEYIETLREGAPAPAGTPLHIRQQVLAMDEESALNAATGGIDFKDIGVFIEWMLESQTNVDQVIPDQLGVVSIMARREAKDYGDTFLNIANNAKNQASWWLIRNGEQLYLHTTEFSVGRRLVPQKDEFTKMFQTTDWKTGDTVSLTPGSSSWLAAERTADAHTRHYMKIALILQGLIDRTTVFRPLPVEGLNLLTQDHYESGHARIIADDEMSITQGRQPFREWQAERLEKLDVGMRVIGHFNGRGEDDTDRKSSKWASAPQSLVPHTVTRINNVHLWFAYDRTDTIGRRNVKVRGSYRLDRKPWGPVTYLPVDSVTVEELEYYLTSRTERHAYMNMFPAITAANAFKKQEEREEAPFRALIAAALAAGNYAAEDTADDYAGELISWWKTKNKWHRALNGDGDHERKAQKGIITEAERRAGGTDQDQVIADSILERFPASMVVARRTNDFIAVEPHPRKYENAGAANVYVIVHEFTGKGKHRSTREWQTLTHAQTSRWSLLHHTEEWSDWKLGVQTKWYLTDPQIDEAVAVVLEKLAAKRVAPVVMMYGDGERGAERKPRIRVATTSDYEKSVDRWNNKTTTSRKLRQGNLHFKVTTDGQSLKVEDGYGYSRDWSVRHSFTEKVEPGADSPHLERYQGDVDSAAQVWFDEELYSHELALGAEWFAAHTAREKARDIGQAKYMQLCNDWEKRTEARLFARFMDDFGDESLWEGHRKALKTLSYPYRRTTRPEDQWDDTLRAVGRAAAEAEDGGAGLSVAEMLELYDVAVEIPLPDDILELTLPSIVPSTEVAIR